METFHDSDITIYTGIKKPLLDHWIARGWVRPSIQTALESGSENIFSRQDLYHIAFLKKVKESGFSLELALDKINIYTIYQPPDTADKRDYIGIAFSRVIGEEGVKTQGAWIVSSTLDKETGWDSLALIGDRLKEGADDFYIVNFTKLKDQIDSLINQVRGQYSPGSNTD